MYWDEKPEKIDKRYLKSQKVTALCALNAKKGYSRHTSLRVVEEDLSQ